MNKVILMGRLTGDPEVRYGTGERNMAAGRYTLAVNRRYQRNGEQQEAYPGSFRQCQKAWQAMKCACF